MIKRNDIIDLSNGELRGLTNSVVETFINSSMVGEGLSFSGLILSAPSQYLDIQSGIILNGVPSLSGFEELYRYDVVGGTIPDQSGIGIKFGLLTTSSTASKEIKIELENISGTYELYYDAGHIPDTTMSFDIELLRDAFMVDGAINNMLMVSNFGSTSVVEKVGPINWGSTVSVILSVSASTSGDIETYSRTVRKII